MEERLPPRSGTSGAGVPDCPGCRGRHPLRRPPISLPPEGPRPTAPMSRRRPSTPTARRRHPHSARRWSNSTPGRTPGSPASDRSHWHRSTRCPDRAAQGCRPPGDQRPGSRTRRRDDPVCVPGTLATVLHVVQRRPAGNARGSPSASGAKWTAGSASGVWVGVGSGGGCAVGSGAGTGIVAGVGLVIGVAAAVGVIVGCGRVAVGAGATSMWGRGPTRSGRSSPRRGPAWRARGAVSRYRRARPRTPRASPRPEQRPPRQRCAEPCGESPCRQHSARRVAIRRHRRAAIGPFHPVRAVVERSSRATSPGSRYASDSFQSPMPSATKSSGRTTSMKTHTCESGA